MILILISYFTKIRSPVVEFYGDRPQDGQTEKDDEVIIHFW
jgi:hypothetical protein